MALTLVNDLSGLFRNQALGEASVQLGEPENSVMRGFQAAAAAILGGLANRETQPGFARQVYELISSPANDGGILNNIRGIISGRSGPQGEGLGSRMLSIIFGGQQSMVAEGISQASGLRPSSATAIMGIAAPVVVGVLGKRVHEEHLDASGLSNLLQSESSEVRSVLPANLMSSVQGVTGAARDTVTSAASSARSTAESAYRTAVESRPPQARWLWPAVLGALLLIGLIWLFSRGREQTARVSQQATDQVRSAAGGAADQVRSAAVNLGSFFHLRLPDGTELNIPQNGMEAHLVAFIQDPAKQIDSNMWFEFDRVSFEPNSATLRAESQEELNNIAAIMKAYPNVHLKIGGYTDNTGDPAANLTLSGQRADTVMQQLAGMGIAADRMEAKGYGDEHPIADNSTDEGRARNRRVAVQVTQK